MSQSVELSDPKAPSGPAATPPRRRRRWVRPVRWLALLIGLVVASGFVLTRSWCLVMIITPRLSERLGGDVTLGHAKYIGDGVFVLENVSLSTPYVEGPGGMIAQLDRMEVLIDVGALWDGDVVLRNVNVSGLHLRLTEDKHQTGFMNFMTLSPKKVDGPAPPPSVQIDRARIEVGLHEDGRFEYQGERLFTGIMRPIQDQERWYTFDLDEIVETAALVQTPGIRIQGSWHSATFEFEVNCERLDLNDDTFRLCPSVVKVLSEQTDLQGRVEEVIIAYKPGEFIDIQLTLHDVSMILPTPDGGNWAVFRDGKVLGEAERPRMHVEHGVIKLGLDRMELLDLVGTVGEVNESGGMTAVPFELTMVIDKVPLLDWERRTEWVQNLAAQTPFTMDCRIRDFDLHPNPDGTSASVLLPMAIARAMERFALIQCTMNSEFQVRRSGGGSVSELAIEGALTLADARGAFVGFPYPLHDIDAGFVFDRGGLRIDHFTARSANEGPVTLAGEIALLDREPMVKLRLTAEALPVDGQFLAALGETRRAAFERFFHEPSHRALQDAGFLADVPEFHLGGEVDLDLSIDRRAGPEMPTVITGEIEVGSLGVIYEKFPYPLRVTSGRVRLLEDRAELVSDERSDGLTLVTHGGGRGRITGHVGFSGPRDDLVIRPELKIGIEGDHVTDALCAALPRPEPQDTDAAPEPSPGPITSTTGRILRGMGLDGELAYVGVIGTGPDDKPNYDLRVSFAGSATPGPDLAEMIGGVGLVWPEDFSLQAISGQLRVTPQRVEFAEFRGRHPDGDVTAEGFVDLDGSAGGTVFAVEFDNLSLGPYLVNLAPSESSQRIRELWDRYQPSGTFDLDLSYRAAADEAERLVLAVVPGTVGLVLDETAVTLHRREGRLNIRRGFVEFENLALDLESQGRSDGSIQLDGGYETIDGGDDFSLIGSWRQGRLESPVVPEVLHLLGAKSQLEQYRARQPEGQFDADFFYDSPLVERTRNYGITINPRSLRARLEGGVIQTVLEEESQISITPGEITLTSVAGRTRDGSFFLEGVVSYEDGLDIHITGDYSGPLSAADITALLPESARRWAGDIKFDDDMLSSVQGGDLRVRQVPTDDGSGWETRFTGRVTTEAAAFEVGLQFSDVEGEYDVTFVHRPGVHPDLTVRTDISSLRIQERMFTNVATEAQMSADDPRLRFPLVTADCYGGKICVEAAFGLGDDPVYEVGLELIGIGLDGFLIPSEASAEESLRGGVVERGKSKLYGSVRMLGERGRPEARYGRGFVRAQGGRVAAVPLALRVVQMLQLAMPLGTDINYADGDYYIDGDRLVFEHLIFEAASGEFSELSLEGQGFLDLKTFELDLMFRIRTGTMSILRNLLGGLGDQLMQIHVFGPVTSPEAEVITLPGLNGASASPLPARATVRGR